MSKLHIHRYSNGLYCDRCQMPKPGKRDSYSILGWLIVIVVVLAVYGSFWVGP